MIHILWLNPFITLTSSIVTDTQLPEGHETVKKIIDMEEWMEAQRKAQFEFEYVDEPGIPLFPVPLSPVTIPEMDAAKFICKVKASDCRD